MVHPRSSTDIVPLDGFFFLGALDALGLLSRDSSMAAALLEDEGFFALSKDLDSFLSTSVMSTISGAAAEAMSKSDLQGLSGSFMN